MQGRSNPRVRHRTPPSFLAFESVPSVDALPAVLAPNGVAQEPMLRYSGKDAGASAWPAWGYGPALALAGAGTEPTIDQASPLMGAADGAVLLNSGKGYGSAEAVQGDLATEDLVVEVVFRYHAAAGGVIVGKRLTGAAGWQLYRGGAEYLSLTIEDADGDERTVTGSGTTLVAGVWYHLLAYINRDEASANGSRLYLNGVAIGTGVDCSAAVASAASAAAARIGVDGSDAGPSGACIAYAAAWKRAAWIQAGAAGAADMATLAAQRFAMLTGTAARISRGSRYPTVATRASTGALDRIVSGVRRFFRVGDNWIRQCERTDLDGVLVRGTLIELQRRNLCLQSTSPSNVAWTAAALGAWGSAAGVCDGYTCDGLVADANDVAHYVEQDRTLTAAVHTFSAIVKMGASRWCYLDAVDVANARAYFDLQGAGAVGTVGAGCTAFKEALGGGWFRVWIVFTATAAVHTLRVGAAAADNDDTFAGAGAADTWIQHLQCEAGAYPSAPIMTTSVELSRIKDSLRYSATGIVNGSEGRIEADILVPQGDLLVSVYALDASQGGGAVNIIRVYLSSSTDVVMFVGQESSVQRWASYVGLPDLFDGRRHRVALDWRSGRQAPEADGVSATPTTFSGTMPSGIDRLDVGSSLVSEAQFSGLIGRMRISPKARR